MKPAPKPRVLFLCTGNACRSQMAEGWARHLWGDRLEPWSAGVLPCFVHPDAITVMAEAGVDLSGHWSKHVEEVRHLDFDLVVTVCDLAHERCPVLPGAAKTVHHSFEDPVGMEGTREEVLEAFRRTRDRIRAFVETLPSLLEPKDA